MRKVLFSLFFLSHVFVFALTNPTPWDISNETITSKSVNDPPIANDQSLKTDEETPLKIKLTGSDPEDDPLTYLIKTLPTNGILKEGANTILVSELPKLLAADSLTYFPNDNFVGNDSAGKISILFGIYGIPESILVDSDLIVLKKIVGPIDQIQYDKILQLIQ